MNSPQLQTMPTQVKDPERELRLSLQNLEPKALDQFFERYFNSIYSRVFSQVRNRQDAEDLTQDVLLKLQRAFPSLDPSRQLDPWVNTILKNRVLDHWRHRGAKRDSVSYDDPDSTLHLQPVTDGSPFDEQVQSEDSDVVLSAIGTLSEGLRRVLMLRVYEGLSYGAIGARLGLSSGTARKRYSRALESLRDSASLTQLAWGSDVSLAAAC